jgi:hypothetical protein
MVQRALLPPAFSLVLLAGCTYSPFFLLEEHGLKRALPSDISMSDYVEKDWFGNKVTVAEKLARLGAYAEGEKIRDGTGQEIRFIKHEDRSLKTTPELAKKEEDELRALKKRYTVIEVRGDPERIPAVSPLTGTGDKQTRPAATPLPPTPQPAQQSARPTQPAAAAPPSGWQPVQGAGPSGSNPAPSARAATPASGAAGAWQPGP